MSCMLSSFLGQKQEITRTAICNHLASEVEGLDDKDFQTFRIEAVKLLSSIQSRAEERSCQPNPQQQTLSRSSRATSTFVPQTFQQPQQPAPAAREYILQQQSTGQPTSFQVVDNQQAGPLRPLTFTLTLMKQLNPPSVASATGRENQHNISGPSSFFENLPSVLSYQQVNTLQPFPPPDPQQASSP